MWGAIKKAVNSDLTKPLDLLIKEKTKRFTKLNSITDSVRIGARTTNSSLTIVTPVNGNEKTTMRFEYTGKSGVIKKFINTLHDNRWREEYKRKDDTIYYGRGLILPYPKNIIIDGVRLDIELNKWEYMYREPIFNGIEFNNSFLIEFDVYIKNYKDYTISDHLQFAQLEYLLIFQTQE